jgi:hypothetical protein
LKDKHEELQLRHSEIEERRKKESDLKRRLERELDDLERELRGTREKMDLQVIAFKKEKRELQSSFQLALDSKEKVSEPRYSIPKTDRPKIDHNCVLFGDRETKKKKLGVSPSRK